METESIMIQGAIIIILTLMSSTCGVVVIETMKSFCTSTTVLVAYVIRDLDINPRLRSCWN